MRIGEFAKMYGVSRDTVRYYVELGLLLPDRKTPQFQFAQRECRDMEIILRMKNQRFSLDEIHRYLDIQRVSTMVEPDSIRETMELLEGKREELKREIDSLRLIRTEIDQDIRNIARERETGRVSGVPLAALNLLTCPHCGSPLRLKGASLDSRFVYEGTLYCGCGYQIRIEDGIVCTDNLYTGAYDSPDLERRLYHHVSRDFGTLFQKCADETLDVLGRIGLKGKIVLEGHVNSYFFLYSNFSRLETDCLYVLTDKYPETLRMYKRNIDQLNLDLNILYLADASVNWPLRRESVDVLVNFTGDNEHSLYFKTPYIRDVKPFLKRDARVVGAALGYHSGARSLQNLAEKYPEGDLGGWRWDERRRIYAAEGYEMSERVEGTMRTVMKRFAYACHEEGEEIVVGDFYAVPVKK